MEITVINVGYGDAILIETDDGCKVLLDGGSNLATEFGDDPYRIRPAEYLAKTKTEHLDAVVISHIHEDHVCGLEAVLQQVKVDRLYVPYPPEVFLSGCELTPEKGSARSVFLYTEALNAYRRILMRAGEEGIPLTVLTAGDVIDLGHSSKMKVLLPQRSRVDNYMKLVEKAYGAVKEPAVASRFLAMLDACSNHAGMLLRFELADTVFLSAADTCPCDWDDAPSFLLKNVNVLKMPHHGQLDSVSELYMAEMPLQYVITTAASDRRYNSANKQVYRRLTAMHPDNPPRFLFSDEREYPPFFSQPDGFQAIQLRMNSGELAPVFIKI